jgi:hypothetical protein
MRELISDLLAYTEVGARAEAPAEAVDLNAGFASPASKYWPVK